MRFIITVDTEADDQWSQDGTVGLKNLEELPRFQSFVESQGFIPTYLASHETLRHPALAALAEVHRAGRAEIGGHLHPWTTPPYDETDARVQRFPSELPEEVLSAKLTALTDALTALLGEPPRSFRAGRWGFDARVARALAERGYTVDSSVTPGVSWPNIVRDAALHSSVPDFTHESPELTKKWAPGLLEVPMTVLPTGFLRGNAGRALVARAGRGIAQKVARALARPRWCRIFPETTVRDLKAVYEAARAEKLSALVFMIHSSELMPGGSPYAKNKAAVERTYAVLSEFLTFLKAESVTPSRMRDVAP